MLDKTIMVFYINVDSMATSDVPEYIKKIQATIKPLDEDRDKVINYIIPVRNQETRVECLNAPIVITSEEQKHQHMLNMQKVDTKLDRITSHINAENESRKVLTEKN